MKQHHKPERNMVNALHMHCSHKNIILTLVSDKTSMTLTSVFSQKVINNKTPQQQDVFSFSFRLQ